jgi:DNA-binding winged helix-turn-helix (wHTH) protein
VLNSGWPTAEETSAKLGLMRSVFFGPFRLEIRTHHLDPNETVLRLFCKDKPHAVQRLQLRLLRFLADEHPGEDVTADEIAATLWPDERSGDNVEKQVSLLRKELGESRKATEYKFIATVRDTRSYRFIAAVRSEGDLERVSGLPQWDNRRLLDRLGKLRRNEEDPEDLRIVTGGLVPSKQDVNFEDYVRHGVRIRIVMTNPENMTLLKARHDLRTDKYTAGKAQADLREQIEYLRVVMCRYAPDALQVRLSNAIPSLIMHARKWALLGTFPAQGQYVLGPMIEAAHTSSLWRNLYDEWKVRWADAAVVERPPGRTEPRRARL